MTELLILIGTGIALSACVVPSLFSLSIEYVPKSMKTSQFLVVIGALVILGTNAVAG